MKKSKTQKGITLIALIITIVVLLILAVVAIRAVQGDGIIEYARNAADEYTAKSNEEKGSLDTLLGQIEENFKEETPDRKTVSGNILSINDVSETEHNLKVNLSSDTVVDFSGVSVWKYGKNLFDATKFNGTDDVNKVLEKTNNSISFEKRYSPYSGGVYMNTYLPKGNYVMNFKGSTSSEEYGGDKIVFTVKKVGASSYLHNSSGARHLFTISESAEYQLKILAPYSAPVGTISTIENIQLEYGTTKTNFVPYIEPQIVTANSDGSVEGLTSISPDMTLMTDNGEVTITCEYQKRNLGMPLSISANSMVAGDVLKLEKNILKKDQRYTFSADITSFDSIKIYHGVEIFSGGYVEITNTSINSYIYSSQYELKSSVEHNLLLNDKINIILDVDTFGKLTVTLSTDSGSFVAENMSWGACRDLIQAESVGSTLSNVQFTWTTTEYEKEVWVFGDSWMSLGEDGWTYYLLKDKDSFSVSGYGGGVSPYLYNDFVTGLTHATPKYAVWALGMNEGDSETDVINSTWKEYVQKFLEKCKENHITPILVTIPSSETINNDVKNEYIRNSGYRYIDFATAMGANEYGTGYADGLAKPDGNHPTEKGAEILAKQALKDFPEIQ